MNTFSRMQGLLFTSDDTKLGEAIEGITLELLKDGFDEDDILEFLDSKVRNRFEKALKKVGY